MYFFLCSAVIYKYITGVYVIFGYIYELNIELYEIYDDFSSKIIKKLAQLTRQK